MITKPALDEIKNQYLGYSKVAVSAEIPQITDAVDVLRKLRQKSAQCYMLESAQNPMKTGRYTFLGWEPQAIITCKDGKITVLKNGKTKEFTSNPREYLKQLLEENRSPRRTDLPPFTGGLSGYFGYDYIKYSEPSLTLDADDDSKFNDLELMLFDRVIAFDYRERKIILIVNISTRDVDSNYQKAVKQLEEMAQIIKNGEPAQLQNPVLKSPFKALFDREQYSEMVEKAKRYIREGDIFQVVLSNRLEAKMDGSIFAVYEILRQMNPSPYMFYFSLNDVEIAGASPETLVKLEDGALYTYPLAGTRPRGETPSRDCQLEQELLNDKKEIAEHNMLVDLGRNDLGKISKFGTVRVDKYHQILKFSHVMHIGSTVKSEISDDKTALDAVDAVLPAGTLSGAPKIRAMQIINELENNKRGIYGGAIGYIDFSGNMDTCIGIRIAVKKGSRIYVRSGAGIVADSVSGREYQECINKAKAVVKAINLAGRAEYDSFN